MICETVTAKDGGRPCPYCRFPLKSGVVAGRCGGCDALHHHECWEEGAGCAVFGCIGARPVATDTAAVHVPPAGPIQRHPPASSSPWQPLAHAPPPAHHGDQRHIGSARGFAIGVGVTLAIVAAAGGGYLLAGARGDGAQPDAAQTENVEGSAAAEELPGTDATDEPLEDPSVTADSGSASAEGPPVLAGSGYELTVPAGGWVSASSALRMMVASCVACLPDPKASS